MMLKKGLLTKLEKKKILRQAIQFLSRACFGWVGRSTANQHFFLRLALKGDKAKIRNQ